MVTHKYVALMFFIGADIFSDVQRIVYPLIFAHLAKPVIGASVVAIEGQSTYLFS
jgi:hypothetical protein